MGGPADLNLLEPPFPCKTRGICPSCNAMRMAQTAAHLVDHVFPHVPVRQWVLSVPKRLRPFLHLFGSSLNPQFIELSCAARPSHRAARLHYHLRVVDGLFERIEDDSDPDPANPDTRLRVRIGEPTSPH